MDDPLDFSQMSKTKGKVQEEKEEEMNRVESATGQSLCEERAKLLKTELFFTTQCSV